MRLTATEIAVAIKDEEWQKFRMSLKGLSTKDKLRQLEQYMYDGWTISSAELDVRLVRVQNYLNALARGGQIEPTDKTQSVHDQIMYAKIRR